MTDTIQKYNKLIVALVGALVQGIALYYGSPEWLNLLIPFLTAAGVYQIPNKV